MPKTMLFLILLLISFVAASDAHTSLNSSFDSLGPTVQNIETKMVVKSTILMMVIVRVSRSFLLGGWAPQ